MMIFSNTLLLWGRMAQESADSGSLLTSLLIPIIVITFLVLLNGFFVAAEFALLGSRASRMAELAENGNRFASRIQQIIENTAEQNRYLATAQLGITIVTLALSMYAEPRIAHFLDPILAQWLQRTVPSAWVHAIATLISLTLLTYLHVVIGEMIPKSLALTEPDSMALRLTQPMLWLGTLFGLLIRFLNGVGDLFLRLLRIPPAHGRSRLYSSEEIEQIVSESTEGGLLTADAEELISNIFSFSDRLVGQVMTPRRKIQGISADISQEALLKLVSSSRHSRFPVYQTNLDHIIGILHLKDLVRYQLQQPTTFSLQSVLRPAPFIPDDKSVDELLHEFKQKRTHMAVVLDEFGGVAGVVTLEDLVEEVVGEVRDEFDVESEPYLAIAPGTIEVDGDYQLHDLTDDVFLGEEEDLPDVDTIGGLIVTLLGRPAQIGDEVDLDEVSVKLTVLSVEGRAVTRVRINFPAPEEKKS